MNSQISIYKKLGEYITDGSFYFLSNSKNNNTILACKYDSETSFYLENPSSDDLINFTDFLEVKEFNFLYLKRNSDLLFAIRKDKAHYVVSLITNVFSKECIITSKNSVKIIADRFIENSLFDGRKNEVRYLKDEHWYEYKEPDTLDHPLRNRPLEDIGKNLVPLVILEIYLNDKNHLQNPEYYKKELVKDYSYIEGENYSSIITKQIETTLDYKILSCYKEPNKLFIDYPYTSIRKEKLKELPNTYRFLNECMWHLTLKTTQAIFKSYFINIQYTYESYSFLFEIKGYDRVVFEQLFGYTEILEDLTIYVSRPMKLNEETSKSICIEYDPKKMKFIALTGKEFSKESFLFFLDEWID